MRFFYFQFQNGRIVHCWGADRFDAAHKARVIINKWDAYIDYSCELIGEFPVFRASSR